MSTEEERRADRARRRENIMEQRLRKSRGEEVEEDLSTYDSYDDDDRPRGFSSAPRRNFQAPRGSSGCAPTALYLVLGGLAALLILLFFFSRAIGGIGDLFPRVPDISVIVQTPTPVIQSGAAVVQRIQQLSRLETSSYTIERVIDVRQGSNVPIIGDFLAGDELLLIAHGTVVAGINLEQLPTDAVTIAPDGTSITLRMPPAELFSASLDNSKTRIYSRDRGMFAPDNKDLETLARQEAERQILQAACEDGIMSRATVAAEQSMRQFLSLLDYDEIVIVPSSPAACVAPIGVPGATPAPASP